MSISPTQTGEPAGFGPVEPSLDHLVYAVPDLDAAAQQFAAATGVTPVEGGRHLGRGTRNVLVGLGETSYLEIIGPDPEQPADSGVAPLFGSDALSGPRLVAWAIHPADLEVAAAAAAAAGADLGPIVPLSRRTPAGVVLQWRLTSADPTPLDGIIPFLIDWATTAHPAPPLPRLTLSGLRATHPDPLAVSAVLDALDVRLTVEPGPPGLSALLGTPRGPVVVA
jgi:Glyoxalase-like domain